MDGNGIIVGFVVSVVIVIVLIVIVFVSIVGNNYYRWFFLMTFQPYADHLNGQKHKKKEAAHGLQQKLEQCPKPAKAVASTTSRLYCELCDVACGSVDTFSAHIRGVKHLRVSSPERPWAGIMA